MGGKSGKLSVVSVHPSLAGAQRIPSSIDNRAHPALTVLCSYRESRGTNTVRPSMVPDSLEFALWSFIDFVHDTEMPVLGVHLVPPIPDLAMDRFLSPLVHMLVGAEVKHLYDL